MIPQQSSPLETRLVSEQLLIQVFSGKSVHDTTVPTVVRFLVEESHGPSASQSIADLGPDARAFDCGRQAGLRLAAELLWRAWTLSREPVKSD